MRAEQIPCMPCEVQMGMCLETLSPTKAMWRPARQVRASCAVRRRRRHSLGSQNRCPLAVSRCQEPLSTNASAERTPHSLFACSADITSCCQSSEMGLTRPKSEPAYQRTKSTTEDVRDRTLHQREHSQIHGGSPSELVCLPGAVGWYYQWQSDTKRSVYACAATARGARCDPWARPARLVCRQTTGLEFLARRYQTAYTRTQHGCG